MKKSGNVLGKILLAAVILLVIAVGTAGFIISVLNREREAAGFEADLEGYESAGFVPVGNGFAAMSEIAVRLYGENGETLGTIARSYPNLMYAGGENAVAVWSSGGEELSVLKADGESYDLSFLSGVTNADLNDSGYAIVLAGEKGYKGSVSVIRPDGEAAYRVYVGSGYPVDADLSPDSRNAAILSLTAEGSRVSIYSLDREEPQNEWNDSASFFELEYLPGGRILLLSANEAVVLSGDGKSAWEFPFGEEYLNDFSAAGDNGIVLVLGKYKTGSTDRIVLLDQSCTATAQMEVQSEVRSICAAGKYLAVRYSDEITIYDWNLNALGSLNSAAGADAALMRSDGSAIIISGGGAAIFEP